MSNDDKARGRIGSSEFDELVGHLDIHVTEHDLLHAGKALRLAWERVRDEYERRIEEARSSSPDIWTPGTLAFRAQGLLRSITGEDIDPDWLNKKSLLLDEINALTEAAPVPECPTPKEPT